MIIKRRMHKLPKFPPKVRDTFKNLCETLPVATMRDLQHEIDHCLEDIRERALTNKNIDIRYAEELSERSHYLVEHYEEFSPKEQSLIVGAIRYFAIADDPFSEDDFASGFIDDVKIMNYVLEELEIVGKFIELY